MTPTIITIDLTTRVFQVHFVDSDTGAIHSKVLKRAQLLPFFANRRVSRVVMEACGSAHHWARQLAQLGHDVRFIAAQFVRPFLKSIKNDAADATAIWEAAQRRQLRVLLRQSQAGIWSRRPTRSSIRNSNVCMHRDARATTAEINGAGHAVLESNPREIAAMIEQAAQKSGQ